MGDAIAIIGLLWGVPVVLLGLSLDEKTPHYFAVIFFWPIFVPLAIKMIWVEIQKAIKHWYE